VLMHLDMGSVPAWAGAGSLLLTIWILVRDRKQRRRAQVEELGIWGTAEAESHSKPPSWAKTDHPEPLHLLHPRIFALNASNLPVSIAAIEYAVRYKWLIPLGNQGHNFTDDFTFKHVFGASNVFPGQTQVRPTWQPLNGPGVVDVVGNTPNYKYGVDEFKPDAAIGLAQTAEIDVIRCFVADNAGRRWIVRPGQGKLPRRARAFTVYRFLWRWPTLSFAWHSRLSKKVAGYWGLKTSNKLIGILPHLAGSLRSK
jgi:hypothetical protein